MALVGKLEDLQLAELFHLLSLFKKSGKLTLTAEDSTGFFYFKDGKICHASNGKVGMPLGELLLRRNMISRSELETALRYQVEMPEWRRLGTILVEEKLVKREDLDALLRERLQKVTEAGSSASSRWKTVSRTPNRVRKRTSNSPRESTLMGSSSIF